MAGTKRIIKPRRKRGPAAKPLAERVAKGDGRAIAEKKRLDAAPKNTVPKKAAPKKTTGKVQKPAAIEPPRGLKATALKMWRDVAPELIDNNLLTADNAHSFTRYCELWVHYLKAEKTLTRVGVGEPSAIMAVTRLSRELERFEDRFGMNPFHRQTLFKAMAARAPGQAPQKQEPAKEDAPALTKTSVQDASAIGFMN